MLDKIKKTMRLTGTALDDVLKMNIEACLLDLEDQAIEPSEFDPKVIKAVELFCKWQTNYNGEAERFRVNYEGLRDSMSLQTLHRSEQDA